MAQRSTAHYCITQMLPSTHALYLAPTAQCIRTTVMALWHWQSTCQIHTKTLNCVRKFTQHEYCMSDA